jgi:glutathione S-transferase
MSKVTLLQFRPAWGLPNPSPFCFKLEAWMQMVGIDYQVKVMDDPRKSPKGKLPCLVDGERTIADSSHIVQYLEERFEVTPDGDLTPLQRSQSVAFQRLCEDHLYWALVYSRWIDEAGWKLMKPILGRSMPIPLRWFVPALVRSNVGKQLHAQGLGRHTQREVYRFAKEDLNALAARLEGVSFMHGDNSTSIDAVLLGTLANILWTPVENEMVHHARSLPVLDAYCKRVWERCFPDRTLPDLVAAH